MTASAISYLLIGLALGAVICLIVACLYEWSIIRGERRRHIKIMKQYPDREVKP
jgi:hypothetical protein